MTIPGIPDHPLVRVIEQDDTAAHYLERCYDVAQWSPDPSTKNGAVIVTRHGAMYPNGWNTPHHNLGERDLSDREQKLIYTEHAERVAIFRAACHGIELQDATMYCPWFACIECARAILFAGIERVVGHKQRMELTPERWADQVATANRMLVQGGVALDFYDGVLDVETLVNGEMVSL